MLTSKKLKDGFYHFFWNGRDVTGLWMDFFSGLGMEEENRAAQLFIKRYSKELNKLAPKSNVGDK